MLRAAGFAENRQARNNAAGDHPEYLFSYSVHNQTDRWKLWVKQQSTQTANSAANRCVRFSPSDCIAL